MPASRRRQRFGQHFLTDARVLDRQLEFAQLDPNDVVLEIGPGLGALTKRLREHVKKVIAVELDPLMIAELRKRGLEDEKVVIVQGDAATLDYSKLGPFNKIVANLPYSASSPITFKLLDVPFERAVLMYQREFALRMAAAPGTDDYGRLSAALAYFVKVKILQRVGPGAFSPPPDVDSALVELVPHATKPFEVASPASYLDLLRVVFSTRRKTLRATLRRHHAELRRSWEHVEQVLRALEIADRRPEELSPAELGRLDLELGRKPSA